MTEADRPWLAERVVDVDRATAMIAGAAPELAGRPVRAFAEGWDNAVFAVDPHWLFRFCRRRIAVAGIGREIAVLPRIAPELPLPIPVPRFVGHDGHPDEPWPFFGTPGIDGDELAVARLDDRGRLATDLGGFLRVLHGLSSDLAAGAGLPTDPMSRAWPAARHEDTTGSLRRLADTVSWSGLAAALDLLEEAARLGPPSRPVRLVHGDLHLRHVLVGDGGGCAGVIDWGDLCFGDATIDLAIGFAAFAGADRDAFVAAYTDGGGWGVDVDLRARALALRMTGYLALHAVDIDDAPMVVEAVAGLDRAVR